MKENMKLSYHGNARMKHDDESHGCMREEDKKREVANEIPMSKS